MIKKKTSLFVIICIIISIIWFQYLPLVKGITESFVDPENDIYRINLTDGNIDKTSSHDEMDIINIALDGQYTNVTFAGNITGHDIVCSIYFFENYDSNNMKFEYAVHYSNFTGSFKVIFIQYNYSGEDIYYKYWNGTLWSSSNTSAQVIGSFSDYTIEANVPFDAFPIHENVTWFVASTYVEGDYGYLDCAPDSFCPYQESIPGFEFFTLIGVTIGITAIIITIKKKRL